MRLGERYEGIRLSDKLEQDWFSGPCVSNAALSTTASGRRVSPSDIASGATRAPCLAVVKRPSSFHSRDSPLQREDAVSPIQTKLDAVSWLAKRLAQEGPDLWADREREEIAKRLAQDYRAEGPVWRVKEWTQQPENTSVQVVTRGGSFGIYSVDDQQNARGKADAIMRALNALDTEVRDKG
jgi:hypothetical protein